MSEQSKAENIVALTSKFDRPYITSSEKSGVILVNDSTQVNSASYSEVAKKKKLIVEHMRKNSKPRSNVHPLSSLASSIDRNMDFQKAGSPSPEKSRQHELKMAQIFANCHEADNHP